MSLRRPFVHPRSTRNKSVGNKTRKDKEVESTKSPTTTGVGNHEEGYDHTPISEWRVSDDEEDLIATHFATSSGRKTQSESAQKG